LVELSVSIPVSSLKVEKVFEEITMYFNKYLPEIKPKLLCDTMYKCPESYVIRINVDSETFNEHLETVFQPLKNMYKNAKVRRYCVQSGGGYSNTGRATVTAMLNGQKPTAVFVKYKGHRACGLHEIYWLSAGYIISMSYWNKGTPAYEGDITWFKATFSKGYQEKTVAIIRGDSLSNYEIEITDPIGINVPKLLKPAIEATMRKCTIYHCRTAISW